MTTFRVNGKEYQCEASKPLIRFLRDDLKLYSVKDGCSEGACGACTIIVDGRPVRACVMKTSRAAGKTVLTVEGLSLEEYNAYLVNEAGVDEKTIEPGTVNGLDCLSYEYNGSGVLALTTQMGYILEVSGGPLTDEDFAQTLSIIMASIQAAE